MLFKTLTAIENAQASEVVIGLLNQLVGQNQKMMETLEELLKYLEGKIPAKDLDNIRSGFDRSVVV